jgi:hypothetical protein
LDKKVYVSVTAMGDENQPKKLALVNFAGYNPQNLRQPTRVIYSHPPFDGKYFTIGNVAALNFPDLEFSMFNDLAGCYVDLDNKTRAYLYDAQVPHAINHLIGSFKGQVVVACRPLQTLFEGFMAQFPQLQKKVVWANTVTHSEYGVVNEQVNRAYNGALVSEGEMIEMREMVRRAMDLRNHYNGRFVFPLECRVSFVTFAPVIIKCFKRGFTPEYVD